MVMTKQSYEEQCRIEEERETLFDHEEMRRAGYTFDEKGFVVSRPN